MKSAVKTLDLTLKQNYEKTYVQGYHIKHKKNRIYYEETHPKAAKKVFESIFETKTPLKQKKFPIVF